MTKEIDFIYPCPADQCKNKNKIYRWTHNQCGGRLKLNDEGMLRCLKCGKKEEFLDFRFDCGDHDYEDCSAQGLAHSLGFMDQISVEESEQAFCARTTIVLMEHLQQRMKNQNNRRINIEERKRNSGNNLDGEAIGKKI